MKIIVNKNAVEENLIKAAKKVVEIAKENANNGRYSFYVQKFEGVHSYDLIRKVMELTESTVDCAYKGLGSTHIKFCIKS